MLSKIQKEAYEKFTEFIAVAEVFVEMKAEQAKKRIKKSAMAKKIAAKAANKIDDGIC